MAQTELEQAVSAMADVLSDGMTARDVGAHFTCTEAEALADVMRAAGHGDAADAWLAGHAYGDDDEDDMHYAPRCDACDIALVPDPDHAGNAIGTWFRHPGTDMPTGSLIGHTVATMMPLTGGE